MKSLIGSNWKQSKMLTGPQPKGAYHAKEKIYRKIY
jgi:hypothetical protein